MMLFVLSRKVLFVLWPGNHPIPLTEAYCLNSWGLLNIKKINKIHACSQMPLVGTPGKPNVSHLSLLVTFPGLKDHQNQAQNRKNQ